MKKLHRLIPLMLALALTASLTACAGSGTTSTSTGSTASTNSTASTAGEPAPDLPEGQVSAEKITLRAFQYELDNQTVDFDTLWFYQELEKKTNVHIDWETVKAGAGGAEFRTKYNLMMASGDYPDLIIRAPYADANIEEYGVTQGIIVPIDDYIEANMPNYYSRLSMNNSNAAIPASDGKTYWVGNLTAQNVNHDGNFYINKVWLDKLGLAVPTTIDELTDVLRAFRDGDPNGNGEKDEIPFSGGDLTHQVQGVYTHFAMFGVPLNYFVYASIQDDNTVTFPGYMPGFRPALEWMNLCYSEGLMDKEAITQDSGAWEMKMNAGQVGFTTYLRLKNTALLPEIAEQYISILPPASTHGVSVPRTLEVPDFGAAVTMANKHIPETLRWLDAQFETETMMVSVNGPVQEGGPIDPTLKINDNGKYEIVYIPEDNGLYKYVPVYHGQFFAPGDYYFDIYEMPPHRVERFETSKAYQDAGVLEKNSYNYLSKLVKLNSADDIERTRLYAQIHTLMTESISDFIANGVTDAKWDDFMSKSKSVGVDDYIAINQRGYDEYLANNK